MQTHGLLPPHRGQERHPDYTTTKKRTGKVRNVRFLQKNMRTFLSINFWKGLDMAQRKVGPRGYSRKSANSPTRPKAPRLNVIEGGKEITPSEPTTKPKTGLSFMGNIFRQVVGLGGKANVFAQVLEPTPLADGTIPKGWRPPAPSVDLSPQDIKIGSLDITVYAQDELPTRVDPAVVTLPPQPPTYYSGLPIMVNPRAPVVLEEVQTVQYEPPATLGEPPQQQKLKFNKIISLEDVHVGDPIGEVSRLLRRAGQFGDKRWLGQADVIITSTDYKPYDQAAAIAQYEAWLASQNKLISDIDVLLQPRVIATGRVVNMIQEIWYKEQKLDGLYKPKIRHQFDKFTELSVEMLTETQLAMNTRLAVRAGSNEKRRRDGKSRYGEAYLALKRLIDDTIGGELPELYFIFTDNLVSKPMGRRRPPYKQGYLTFWDKRVNQWRYKAKTPYGIYHGWSSGFLDLDIERFIIDYAVNKVEDAAMGKVSQKARQGHDQMLQQFGKTGREIGSQFGPTL